MRTGPVVLNHGDCVKVVREMPDASVDSVVTDPPYGLGFMGRSWDALPPGQEWAEECLRVLKPGGHMLAFGGTRTWHRLAVAAEDAGFEIRDSIAWMYGNGFPKGATNLKPAFEPVVVARKPTTGSLAANMSAHGTGALNVEGCRIAHDAASAAWVERWSGHKLDKAYEGWGNKGREFGGSAAGRWPPNVVLDESQADALGESSRFFYVAKASRSERPEVGGVSHPTVKPLALMRWLVRLVTPAGGTVLEPFAGSGTTVEACILEGFRCIAIEREADYLPLIRQRIARRRDPVQAVRGTGEDGGLFDLLDGGAA